MCMQNMAQAVKQHNAKILKGDQQQAVQPPGCNCQVGPAACPVQGKCKTAGVIYRATVTETGTGKVETYTGATGNTFKERLGGHNCDMNNRKYRINTCLSNHVWNLKDDGIPYDIQWSLVDRAPPFNPTTRKCRICLKEKKEILYNKDGSSLNKRNEIFNTCRHRTQKLLSNVKA